MYSCRRVGFSSSLSRLYNKHREPMIELLRVHCLQQGIYQCLLDCFLPASIIILKLLTDHCVDSCVSASLSSSSLLYSSREASSRSSELLREWAGRVSSSVFLGG